MTKCQKYPTYAIFLKSWWFKGCQKNDIPKCPKWSDPRFKSPLVDFKLLHYPQGLFQTNHLIVVVVVVGGGGVGGGGCPTHPQHHNKFSRNRVQPLWGDPQIVYGNLSWHWHCCEQKLFMPMKACIKSKPYQNFIMMWLCFTMLSVEVYWTQLAEQASVAEISQIDLPGTIKCIFLVWLHYH